MKKSFEKLFKKFTLKMFKLTGSQRLYLLFLNIGTKLFYNVNNQINYDSINKIYWLKHAGLFLLGVRQPYIYYSKKQFYDRCLNIFCQRYKPVKGAVIIDVGAGNGLELCFFAEMIGENGILYAIEANPESYNLLKLLKQKNNFESANPFNAAISDKTGTLWMELSDNYRTGRTNEHKKGVEVNSYSMDDFVKNHNITKIDFLKVNIEGAEFEMVDGMKNTIGIIDNIAISCHDFLNARDENITSKVKTFLISNGFEVYQRSTGDQVLDSWIYGTRKQ
ncbi:MAG: FkbM family methyltransferase [Bacteroidetes bacterium]|nr:FkbM family methyltransferase [Bacteroidota bacterium]